MTICAGVVTYNADMRLLKKNLKVLMSQVSRIYIVDNGSENVEDINSIINGNNQLRLMHNETNFGVAKALNQLCMMAMHDSFEWILTMDQDSICAPDMVKFLSAFIDNSAYGIIAPRVEFWDCNTLVLSTKSGDKETIEVPACITSGSLTRLEAWEKVGGFDEWYFIDRVDNEFCTHLAVKGYKVLRVNKAILYQRAGKMKYIQLPLVGKLLLPYYDEKRNYYICRNSVYFFRKYRHNIDVVHHVMVFVYSQILKLLFESRRWATLRSTFRGIKDGKKKIIEYNNYLCRGNI